MFWEISEKSLCESVQTLSRYSGSAVPQTLSHSAPNIAANRVHTER